jgi:hypothetical protein
MFWLIKKFYAWINHKEQKQTEMYYQKARELREKRMEESRLRNPE